MVTRIIEMTAKMIGQQTINPISAATMALKIRNAQSNWM
jgi:hypothetical protein